ncbi:hypothetical protein HYN69_07250 [Gemmobacter aquarius]|uniref:Uncharacterized protein n=1 Tax=Paragemmobacter aquarius TaxID=2169400 RepID=A0A2S0UKJ0_9RHOB|nr:hypothetical protein HYN69_07250 [Gemmobacter aquarius]
MMSFRPIPKRAKPLASALGGLAEAVLFICLIPAILILAAIEARRSPRPSQPLLEDRQHRA